MKPVKQQVTKKDLNERIHINSQDFTGNITLWHQDHIATFTKPEEISTRNRSHLHKELVIVASPFSYSFCLPRQHSAHVNTQMGCVASESLFKSFVWVFLLLKTSLFWLEKNLPIIKWENSYCICHDCLYIERTGCRTAEYQNEIYHLDPSQHEPLLLSRSTEKCLQNHTPHSTDLHHELNQDGPMGMDAVWKKMCDGKWESCPWANLTSCKSTVYLDIRDTT